MGADNVKQAWTEPKVIVYGDVKTLTLGVNKSLGTGDSFTFQGQTTKISS
jgi:hypothetical protein